jgi:hypothetical protein
MRRYAIGAALAVAARFVAGGARSAAIVATGGQIVQLAPPPSVSIHQRESDTEMFAFDEQQNVVLPVPLDHWKQGHHNDSWVGYTPDQSFEAIFGRNAFTGDPSLATVLGFGGGLNALGRHAVAALLNAASPDVSYEYSTSEVISKYRAAFDAGTAEIEATKNLFDVANNAGF